MPATTEKKRGGGEKGGGGEREIYAFTMSPAHRFSEPNFLRTGRSSSVSQTTFNQSVFKKLSGSKVVFVVSFVVSTGGKRGGE